MLTDMLSIFAYHGICDSITVLTSIRRLHCVAEAAMVSLTHRAHTFHVHITITTLTLQLTLNTLQHTHVLHFQHTHISLHQKKWLTMLTEHPFQPVSTHRLTHPPSRSVLLIPT
jgi:hypothetical protein